MGLLKPVTKNPVLSACVSLLTVLLTLDLKLVYDKLVWDDQYRKTPHLLLRDKLALEPTRQGSNSLSASSFHAMHYSFIWWQSKKSLLHWIKRSQNQYYTSDLSTYPGVYPENTHLLCKWKFHSMADLLLDWFDLNQIWKSVSNSTQAKQLNPKQSNRRSAIQWYFPLWSKCLWSAYWNFFCLISGKTHVWNLSKFL